MKVFACYNLKGGVGKTATAVNLAHLSSTGGHRTLLWDLDPQASATFYLRVKPRVRGGGRKLLARKGRVTRHVRGSDFQGLDLLPADFSYRKLDRHLEAGGKPRQRLARLLRSLGREYDHVFLDCAPNISVLSESLFGVADAVLVPVIPTTLSARTLEQIASHVERLRRKGRVPRKRGRLLPFFCMVDRRKRMHREFLEGEESITPPPLVTSIPYSSAVERMGVERAPLESFAPRSRPAAAYRDLWAEIRGICGVEGRRPASD